MNTVNNDGTLVNPGSWYTNVWEFMADHCTVTYDKYAVMPKSSPLFGILNSGGDSHFSDMIVDGTREAGVRTDNDGMTWIGGTMMSLKTGSLVGFYFPTASGHHMILGVNIMDIPMSAYISAPQGAPVDSVILIPVKSLTQGMKRRLTILEDEKKALSQISFPVLVFCVRAWHTLIMGASSINTRIFL